MIIVVIIPTYNEAGGIGSVLDELHATVTKRPDCHWIALIVDGNSTDDTRAIVRSKKYTNLDVRLLEEAEKSGIARAYATGMKYAISALHADVLVEFDGDGQHDPKALLPMLQALEDGALYVIGSRYIDGGSVPQNWAWYRRALSRMGSLYARIMLELPVHDVTSGFKMTHVTPLQRESILRSLNNLLSRDYAYKIQLLTEMVYSGARVQEVPIAFRTRDNDSSKSTPRDVWESLRVTYMLRIQHLSKWRLPRVVVIGCIGFGIQTVLFELLGLRWELIPPSLAAVVGAIVAISSNFFLNDRYSFTQQRFSSGSLDRLAKFYVVSSGSVIIQWTLLSIVERVTQNTLTLRFTFLVGVIVGFIINYMGYFFFVWKHTPTHRKAGVTSEPKHNSLP